jgi:hypothetical protein
MMNYKKSLVLRFKEQKRKGNETKFEWVVKKC